MGDAGDDSGSVFLGYQYSLWHGMAFRRPVGSADTDQVLSRVVAVYCVAVRQPQQIREFVIVFFVFYIATLIFDSVFFARIEKQNKTY